MYFIFTFWADRSKWQSQLWRVQTANVTEISKITPPLFATSLWNILQYASVNLTYNALAYEVTNSSLCFDSWGVSLCKRSREKTPFKEHHTENSKSLSHFVPTSCLNKRAVILTIDGQYSLLHSWRYVCLTTLCAWQKRSLLSIVTSILSLPLNFSISRPSGFWQRGLSSFKQTKPMLNVWMNEVQFIKRDINKNVSQLKTYNLI